MALHPTADDIQHCCSGTGVFDEPCLYLLARALKTYSGSQGPLSLCTTELNLLVVFFASMSTRQNCFFSVVSPGSGVGMTFAPQGPLPAPQGPFHASHGQFLAPQDPFPYIHSN